MRNLRTVSSKRQDVWDGIAVTSDFVPPAIGLCAPRIVCISGGADLDALLPVCGRLTPRIERYPNALVLDLTGSEHLLLAREHLWDGDPRDPMTEPATWSRWAERLHALLTTANPAPWRVGVASSRTIAWLATYAANASWHAVTPRETAHFLHPLPVPVLLTLPDFAQALGAAQAVMALDQGGIHTVGQLARLAPPALQRRFGPMGLALARLARGDDLTPLCVMAPAQWLGAWLRLDPPRALEQLGNMLHPLAAWLAHALHQRRQEARDVQLVARVEGQVPWRASRHLGHATASRQALLDQAQRLFERMGCEYTGTNNGALFASAIHLRVGGFRPARPRQRAFWPPHREQTAQQVAELVVGDQTRAEGALRPLIWQTALVAPYAVLPLLPPAKPGGRPRSTDLRAVLHALSYWLRSGGAWHLLPHDWPHDWPHDFPPWKTVYHSWRAWRLSGDWERLQATWRERVRQRAGREPTPSAGIVDSQSIKTTARGGRPPQRAMTAAST